MSGLAIYPVEIQSIIYQLEDADDWGDVWNAVTTEQDRELTSAVISEDACDFIVMVDKDAFVFASNNQTMEWEVYRVGQPVYEVEPEMVGDDSVDFDEFLAELQHELKGVQVKRGSALNNEKSEFVKFFSDALDKAFNKALKNV